MPSAKARWSSETESLPYGQLKEAGLPKDYRPVDINLTKTPIDGSPEHNVWFATMPPVDLEPDAPDGRSIWIVRGLNTKDKVLNHPGFPKRVPKIPHPTPNHIIRTAKGMGLGVFATRDLDIGDLIFAERPLLISTRALDLVAPRAEAHHTHAQKIQMLLFESERLFNFALDRMSAERRAAYKALANSHEGDGSGPLAGVFRTNVYSIDCHPVCDDTEGTAISATNGYAGIGDIASRINHSCVTNVMKIFDVTSFSFQFYARTKIKAGEQLFYSYHAAALQPVAGRQKFLEPYGIVCKCRLCANATPHSDEKLQTLAGRRYFLCVYVGRFLLKPFTRKSKSSAAGLAQARELESMVKMLEEMQQELDTAAQYGDEPLLVFLHRLYIRTGRVEKAQALAKDIVRYAFLEALKQV